MFNAGRWLLIVLLLRAMSRSNCSNIGTDKLPLDKLLNEYQLTFLTKGQEQYLNHPEELTDDRTKYQATLSNGDINYTTKEGVKVMTVLCDHEPVWSHDPVRDRDEYPLKVVLNFNLGVLSVNTHSRTHLYLFDNNRWVHRLTTDLRPSSTPLLSLDCLYPSGSVQKKEELEEELEELEDLKRLDRSGPTKLLPPSQHPHDVVVTTLNYDGTTRENDNGKYLVKRAFYEEVYHYEFKDGVKCVQVGSHGEAVWTYKGGPHPQSLVYYKMSNEFLLKFETHSLICKKFEGEWARNSNSYRVLKRGKDGSN